MLSVFLLLVLVAFLITIASALSPARAPLWVAVLLITVALLVQGWGR